MTVTVLNLRCIPCGVIPITAEANTPKVIEGKKGRIVCYDKAFKEEAAGRELDSNLKI